MSLNTPSLNKPVDQATAGVESGKAAASKAMLAAALKRVTHGEWLSVACLLLMMLMMLTSWSVAYSAGAALKEQAASIQALTARLEQAGIAGELKVEELRVALMAANEKLAANANKMELEVKELRGEAEGAKALAVTGLLVNAQLANIVNAVDMDRQVKAAAAALAPLLEPVSWYNPTVEAVPEVAAAAKEESWISKIRAKLATITK